MVPELALTSFGLAIAVIQLGRTRRDKAWLRPGLAMAMGAGCLGAIAMLASERGILAFCLLAILASSAIEFIGREDEIAPLRALWAGNPASTLPWLHTVLLRPEEASGETLAIATILASAAVLAEA